MANNVDVKDAAGVTRTVKTTDNAAVHTPHHNIDTLPALAAGTAIVGKIGIDQTTPGTTNRVDVGAALPAGAAIIGKVGIDQTTPGTTNRVDVGAALPAGTNNIGDVDVLSLPSLPAGANNIGDVDVLSLPSLPAGANNIGDVDVLSLPALPAGANNIGDVDVLTVPAPLSTAGGGLEATALRVTIASDSTGLVSVDDNGGSLTVDAASLPLPTGAATEATLSTLNGKVTACNTGAVVVSGALPAGANNIGDVDVLSLPALPAGANNIGDVDVLTVPAPLNVVGTGLEATALRVTIASDSTGVVSVDDNGSSLTVDGTVSATASGVAAHDAPVSGNPVRVAGKAINTEGAAVINGDTCDAVTDLTGKQIVLPYANPENFVSGATGDITGVTSTQVIAAGAAGVRNYITHILVQNSHATVGTWVNIQDGSGGTTLYTIYAPAVGGGASVTLPVPIKTTAATGLFAACVTTGANVRVSASGYRGV